MSFLQAPAGFGDELPGRALPDGGPHVAPDPEADFARVFHPGNVEGPQRERWFHALGCRTWFVLTRDTRTNRIG